MNYSNELNVALSAVAEAAMLCRLVQSAIVLESAQKEDRSPVTVGELLNDGKDAQLSAWAYDKRSDTGDGAPCLARSEGEWNP